MIPSTEEPPSTPAAVARAMAATVGRMWDQGWRPHTHLPSNQPPAPAPPPDDQGAGEHAGGSGSLQVGDEAKPTWGPRPERRRPRRRRRERPRCFRGRRGGEQPQVKVELVMTSWFPPLLQWRPPCFCLHEELLGLGLAHRQQSLSEMAPPNQNRTVSQLEGETTSSAEDTEGDHPGHRTPPTSPSSPGGSRLRGSGASSTPN